MIKNTFNAPFLYEDTPYPENTFHSEVSSKWLGRSCGARLRDASTDKTPVVTFGITMYEGDVFKDVVLPEHRQRHSVPTSNGIVTIFLDTK